MKNTLCTLGLATLLLTGVSASGFAAGTVTQSDQRVGTSGTTGTAGTTYSTRGSGGVAQSGPDAAHPTAQLPSGGGGDSGGSSGSGSGGGSGGSGGGSGH